MKTRNRYIILAALCLLYGLTILLPGCANRGVGPQGGPIDSIPPVITKMSVENGARNVQTKELTIAFDEYIQLDGSIDNILVSPPQQRPPEIKAEGKKIIVRFQEDLKDTTTYTIDFGDQIVDNNERNPLKNYSLSFSTGQQIDSLEVYGQVINAEDLNPVSGLVIGLQTDTTDSAFMHQPFIRIGRTNAEGEFSIKNVKSGTYKLYALKDQSRDYYYQPGEGLAFQEELVTPYITYSNETDTLYLPDTLDAQGKPIPDSIITAEYFYFEPSNLLLRYFTEDRQKQYFQRAFRKEAHYIQLVFGAKQDSLPVLSGLPQACIVHASPDKDTIAIWLTDSADIKQDSLSFVMTYYKSDSLLNLIPQTDTIYAVYRAPRINARAKANIERKKQQKGLPLKSNASASFNYFDTVLITSRTPIADFDKDKFHLLIEVDTIWNDVPCLVSQYDSAGLSLQLIANWKNDQHYQILVDSGAVHDVYGMACHKENYKMHIRPLEDYATITVFITPFADNAYIQLLNSSDKPIRTLKATQEGALFSHLEPGTYYMRLFLDENGDGKWTTGDFAKRRQPEQVFYCHKKLTLRANWTFEDTFDWQSLPLLNQKPDAIRKDAGANDKKK